jgi:outer membrane protein insertion porin family
MDLKKSAALGAILSLCLAYGVNAELSVTKSAPQSVVESSPQSAAQPTAAIIQIERISVTGNERIDAQTIASYLSINVGSYVNDQIIDAQVKSLYRTDLFADIQMSLVGNDLQIQVIESPIINQVLFEGNSAMTKDKLREEVQIRPRGVYSKAKVQDDVQRIVELYRKSGRIAAVVTAKFVELPQKRVDLIFEINEGPKTGVASVNFIGNKAFSDKDLSGVVVTQKSNWWQFFSSNDNYDPDRMDYDREQLRKHYTNRGYYDFRVVSAVAELTPDRKDFVITYTIDEGVKYNFGRINVRTDNDKLKPDDLKTFVSIKPGQLYESDRIEKAVDDLTYAAGAAGYAFVNIRPDEEANPETRTVDLNFRINEGERVYIDKINIVGNTTTLDRVIRRQLLLSEGDAYNKALLERSKIYVRGLGYFKEVEIKETPSTKDQKTNIELKVEEQPTGELSFGAGFSSIQKFILDISVAQSNFRGTGQNVRARIQTGSIQKNIDISFTEPYFMGRNVQAGFDIFSSAYSSQYVSYSTESFGGGVRLGYSLNSYSVLRLRYNLRTDKIDSYGAGECNGLLYNCGTGLTSSVGYSLSYDLRNDFQNPTRGWQAILRQDMAGLGGDVKYVLSEGEINWYRGFRKDMILKLSAQIGNIIPWDGDSVRINDRFFKGGQDMRGFEYAGIGPRDTTALYALGGQNYAIASAELGIPNGLPDQYGLKTALFLDLGTVGGLDKKLKFDTKNGARLTSVRDDLSLRATTGITIRWKSPMGPIQFDLSHILRKEEYDRDETFRFSQSTQF